MWVKNCEKHYLCQASDRFEAKLAWMTLAEPGAASAAHTQVDKEWYGNPMKPGPKKKASGYMAISEDLQLQFMHAK